MNNIRDWMPSVQLIIVLSSGLMSNLPVVAQPAEIGQGQQRQVDGLSNNSIFAAPPPPTDYGEPDRRSSAGSRNCPATSAQAIPLTALAPAYKVGNKHIVGGLTTAVNPAFWFYVPFQLSSKDRVEWVLQDAEGNYIYQTKLPGTANSQGIVHLALPSNIALETNQYYRWHFLLYCNSSSPSHFVSGFIKRVSRPTLDQQLATATPREQVKLYADSGLWYDALTTLAELYRQNPQDQSLKQTWARLMKDIQLEPLAGEPFSTCCGSDH